MKTRTQIRLVVITIVYFLALAVVSIFWLTAGGEGAFDGHILGYGFKTAETYLAALSPAQKSLYQGPFRIADTIFPALLALTLLRWFRHQTAQPMRLVLTLLTALYLAADYTENMLVGRLLRLGADGITDQAVTTASGFTQIKWAVLAICILSALWLWFQSREGSAQ